MPILPPTRLEKLEFVEFHLAPWSTAGAAIGLTAAQMTALSAQTSAARTAYNAMMTAREMSENATQNFYNLCQTMVDTTADYLKTIKAYAATTNNPNVFTLAVIPPPKTPSAGPPPAIPTNVSATLQPSGSVQVSWKGKLSGGTAFSVWRKLNQPNDPFVQIATVNGATAYIDETLPAGAAGSAGTGVFYAIKAHRVGLASGLSEPAVIKLGSVIGENGGADGLKIAA